MATFALVTIQPPACTHTAAFFEFKLLLYYSLLDLGHEVAIETNYFPVEATAIVFGAHLIDEQFPVELPENCILFNTEQLQARPDWLARLVALSADRVIWDYSLVNIALLKASGGGSACHRLRLGYHRQLERVPPQRSGEEGFIFYGSVTPFRDEILSRITLSSGLRMQGFFGVYGWDRDGLLSRSLAVVNLHSHPSRLLEWPRIVYLLANRIPCVALLHPETKAEDDQLTYLLAADEARPTPDLEAWYSVPDVLLRHASMMQERFREEAPQASFTQRLLDETSALGFAAAPGPLSIPDWVPCSFQRDPDVSWYRHTYFWQGQAIDPRTVEEYHRQTGSYRQFHPDPAFAACFRPPIQLQSGPHSCSDGASPTPHGLKVAVVLHFHSEPRVHQFFANFGPQLAGVADFYATTSCANVASTLKTILVEYGAAGEIRIIENRGRDIPSKYMLFEQQLQAYDVVLFSHGKDSNVEWFFDHNRILAGSQQRVSDVLALFASQPRLGLLFPDYLQSLLSSISWVSMRRMADALLGRVGMSTSRVELLEFPAGGFFWARPACLKPLRDLRLTLAELPEEPIRKDGTILHAIERLPCLVCEASGFEWQKLARSA